MAQKSSLPATQRGRSQTSKRAAVAGILVALSALPLASQTVRTKLAGAWRGFLDPSSSSANRTDAPSSVHYDTEDESAAETAEIEGDFALLDLESREESSGMEGLVPSLSDLPIPITQRTMRYVEYFGSDEQGRESFFTRARRAGRYRELIVDALRYADMPEDILWLAAIESGFVPQATSPVGAVGLFQFMPETAERFGLTIASGVDERRSITRSTEAAIAYLTFLYDRFGAWDLALAAYNCGEGRMDGALADGRVKLGREEDAVVEFHELAALRLLPKETTDFVPKIHAFAIVAHNAELLTLDDLEPLTPYHFAQIAVPAGTKLATIGKAAGLSLATMRELNPEFLTERLPDGKGDVLVNVTTDVLAQTLAALPVYIAREEPAPEPIIVAEASTTPHKKAVKTPSREAPKVESSEVSSVTKAPSGTKTAKVVLRPAPARPGAFITSSGVVFDIKKKDGPFAISAHIDVLDPLKNRSPIGAGFSLEETQPRDVSTGLSAMKTGLHTELTGNTNAKLRAHLAAKRKTLHEKSQSLAPFLELSQRVFPKGHPMNGALLVGPTEPADDMFLEIEPTWALDTVVTLSGPVDVDALAGEIEATFSDVFAPSKPAPLSKGGRFVIGKSERRVLVGWPAAPPTSSNETAIHLAFVLACHNKLGRFHRALRLDKPMTGRLNCSLELSQDSAVSWVFAMPSTPFTVADIEKQVDASVTALSTEGPTDAELVAARGLLRAELARERESATLRGLPKSWVVARNEAILARLDQVSKKDIIEATKALFGKDRRVVVVSD